MAEFTLKGRRFKPEEGEGPYWETFDVDLEPTLSVLDGLLQAKDRDDGSLAVRCSCRAAICGSCGMKNSGQSTLACKAMLEGGRGRRCARRGLLVPGRELRVLRGEEQRPVHGRLQDDARGGRVLRRERFR